VYEDLLDRAAAEHGCTAPPDSTDRQSDANG
jgi:hypothetical protein